MEMEPDAEHQQNDADLGKLFRQFSVGHEARRAWPDGNPGQQVTDDGRQSKPMRGVAQDQRRRQPSRESQDQVKVVHVLLQFARRKVDRKWP